MAKTWINHKTNQVEIRGVVDDVEMAELALKIGYYNRYMQGVYEVVGEISSDLPAGFCIDVGEPDENIEHPNGIQIGQVTVRHGDPFYPLYLVRKKRGRPTLTGEKMVQTGIWLQREQIKFLKSRGNLSAQIRDMITAAMKK